MCCCDCGDQEGRAAAISRHFPASAPRLLLFSSSSHTHRTLGPVTIQAGQVRIIGRKAAVVHCDVRCASWGTSSLTSMAAVVVCVGGTRRNSGANWRERGLGIEEEWWRHHRVQTILHTSMAWLTHAGAPKPASVRSPASDTGWHPVDTFISTFGGVRDLAEM